jgi:hypothetical protein
MKKEKTERGFDLINFVDRYDNECSLQKSSLAFEEAIWLGVDDPDPKIMASQVTLREEPKRTGWVKYPLPEGVHCTTRMHLTQEQVKKLLPHLKKFVETGEI